MTITPIHLQIDHPNVRNAEGFLNSWDESFKLENREGPHFTLRSVKSKTRIDIFFFDDYDALQRYERIHLLGKSPMRQSTTNGSVLYVIESSDPSIVSNLAGHLAGRE